MIHVTVAFLKGLASRKAGVHQDSLNDLRKGTVLPDDGAPAPVRQYVTLDVPRIAGRLRSEITTEDRCAIRGSIYPALSYREA